ncbi:hypothetical protein AAFF_G00324450 [Aldrovandia affinis]|uniref:Uncharacterized protein n=1 Tax=Aldrovandia affinis TaxID=143900 RepID=A0AAD7R6U3_9TELE|nr:hypothetical protein AAFF_G00324450 [Aldrovandia affinis]
MTQLGEQDKDPTVSRQERKPGECQRDPLNCAFGNRLCEYGVRRRWSGVLELPSPCQQTGEESRSRAGYVGDSPDGETGRQRDEGQ